VRQAATVDVPTPEYRELGRSQPGSRVDRFGAAAHGVYDAVDAIGRGDAAGALRGAASIQPNYIAMAQNSVNGLRHLGDRAVNGDAGDRAEALGTLTPAIVALAFGRGMGRLNTGRGAAVAEGVSLEGGAVAEGAALGDSALAEAAPAARGVRPTRAAQCFVAGTLVMLLTGATPIEDVEVGDIAFAYDVRAAEDGPVVLRTSELDDEGSLSLVAARPAPAESRSFVDTWDPTADRTRPAPSDLVYVLGTGDGVVPLRDVPGGAEVAHRGRVFEVGRRPGQLSLRATGRTLNRVVETYARDTDALVELDVDSSTSTTRLVGTPEHPFLSVDRGEFVPMGELRAGERLLSSSGREARVARSRSASANTARVFNFSVEHAHTYFVGGSSGWVLVHNQCAAPRGTGEVTAAEIREINRSLGGTTELTGNAETVIANMAYREGATAKAATAIRDIAGRHLFNDANKRTAQAVTERLLGSEANPSQIRSVIDQVATGGLRTVEDIADALRP